MTMYQQRPATCDRARAWISRRADDELSEFECALLDAHLKNCASCATFDADVDAMTTLLRTQPLERMSHPVAVSGRRRRRLALPVGAVASAAAVIVTIGGAFAMLGSSGPNRPQHANTGTSILVQKLLHAERATAGATPPKARVLASAKTPVPGVQAP
jgi:predicted anti-sigma-YlaC factor YlaD